MSHAGFPCVGGLAGIFPSSSDAPVCASLVWFAFAKSGLHAHAREGERGMTTYAGKRLGKIIHAVAIGPVLVVPVNRNSAGRKSGPVAAVPELAVVAPRMPVSRIILGVFGHAVTERQASKANCSAATMSLPIMPGVLVPDSTECLVSACFASLLAGITGRALSFWFHDVCADTRPSDANPSLRKHLRMPAL